EFTVGGVAKEHDAGVAGADEENDVGQRQQLGGVQRIASRVCRPPLAGESANERDEAFVGWLTHRDSSRVSGAMTRLFICTTSPMFATRPTMSRHSERVNPSPGSRDVSCLTRAEKKPALRRGTSRSPIIVAASGARAG